MSSDSLCLTQSMLGEMGLNRQRLGHWKEQSSTRIWQAMVRPWMQQGVMALTQHQSLVRESVIQDSKDGRHLWLPGSLSSHRTGSGTLPIARD